MKRVVLSGLAALFCAVAYSAAAGGAPPAVVVSKCQTCHGLTGDSASPTIPRLDGQHAEYIVHRFSSFLDPGSQDPHATAAMWDVARSVSDATIQEVATYYAQQAPMAPLSNASAASAGAKLYAYGNPSEGVAACQTCHGPQALGQGSVPRLAGQHAAYLKNQLERLRLTTRASTTMHPNTNNMSDAEIAALVVYLSKD